MKHILVATDGSDGGDRAVDYAVRLAKAYGADLLIVNVIDGYVLPDKPSLSFTQAPQAGLYELLTSLSTETLAKAGDRARSAGVTMVQLESRAGDVARTIIDIAREKKADAIVIGRRGAGRLAGLLLGSVSQKLISLAPLPVTTVP
ncbi:MAG: universal stress protein [Proteobacteria bacterium]|nr:universal stress protein [Pseudomonadota bacterium]